MNALPKELEESFKDLFGSDEGDSSMAVSGVYGEAANE